LRYNDPVSFKSMLREFGTNLKEKPTVVEANGIKITSFIQSLAVYFGNGERQHQGYVQ